MIKSTDDKHQICNSYKHTDNPEEMECISQNFLHGLRNKIASCDYVLLDFLPDCIKKRHAHYHLELLVSPVHYNHLLEIIANAPSVNFLRTRLTHQTYDVELVFNDLSHLSLSIRTSLRFKNLHFVKNDNVFRTAQWYDGFRIPSYPIAFEYHLLKSMEAHADFPKSYARFFSQCTFQERSEIFASLVPKYKFNINVLDDLMPYRKKNIRLVMRALKQSRENKGLYWFYRMFYPVIGFLRTVLFGRWNYYYHSSQQPTPEYSPAIEFLLRKAYLRTG
jgi:hypothetical protein